MAEVKISEWIQRMFAEVGDAKITLKHMLIEIGGMERYAWDEVIKAHPEVTHPATVNFKTGIVTWNDKKENKE